MDEICSKTRSSISGTTPFAPITDEIGTIQRMLVDREREHVAATVLAGGCGVPLSDIEIRDGDVNMDPEEESRFFAPPERPFHHCTWAVSRESGALSGPP